MKIKTRLEISTIFFICMVLAVGLTLSFTSQQVIEAYEKHSAVDEIVKGAFMLNILTGDYLAHQEERAKTQWHLKHDSLSSHLTGLESKNYEEQSVFNKIRQNHESIKDVFSQLVAHYEEHETSSESYYLRETLTAQLSVKLQNMVSDASLLSKAFQERLATTIQTARMLVASFVIVIVAVIGVNSFLIISTIAKPIADLHEGVEIIRSGNLNHKVGITAKDEIGQLSREFDLMTEDLRARTEELRRSLEELKRSNRELNEYTYVIAHDLRTPLRATTSFSELLLKEYSDKLDETGRDYLKRIRNASMRMAELIRDLLAFSKIAEEDEQEELVDLNRLLEEVKLDLEAQLMEKRVEIQVEELPEVKAPISKIRQLFKELMGNGLKFNDSTTPKVEVGYEEQVSRYVFRVRDNGIGIREEDQKRIFNLFQRLHTQKEYSGIGVGLAKCRRIVESMGGRIWVDSHPGTGSAFYFTYPKDKTEETWMPNIKLQVQGFNHLERSINYSTNI